MNKLKQNITMSAEDKKPSLFFNQRRKHWLGDHGEGKAHDPIPNSTVKPFCGNDTLS
jgi:hypothetical protein